MKFAASLNSASEHLNKGQKSSPIKPVWHLPQDFRCKQEKQEQPLDSKSLGKSIAKTKLCTDDVKPLRDEFGRYTWNGLQNRKMDGEREQVKYAWRSECGVDPNHPAFRGDHGFPWHQKDGITHQHSAAVKIKPVSLSTTVINYK